MRELLQENIEGMVTRLRLIARGAVAWGYSTPTIGLLTNQKEGQQMSSGTSIFKYSTE
jgi:hypothetical protein